jgi:hypothetical protein
MKNGMPTMLGLLLALLGTAAPADDARESAMTGGDPEGNGAAQQSSADGGRASDASGAPAKPASTATAAGALHKGVKEGTIKIEGGTDPGAPGY